MSIHNVTDRELELQALVTKLQGEAGVMLDLLRLAVVVVDVVVGDDCYETEQLAELSNKIKTVLRVKHAILTPAQLQRMRELAP